MSFCLHFFPRRLVTCLSGILVIVAPQITLAQQPWPFKPVRLVVANAAGAVVDTGARIFSNSFSNAIGQPVNVDNRPGADGYLAAEAVARAAPDGYTLFFGSQSVFAIDPHIKKIMPVDPVKDFTPIATLVDDTGATGLFAHSSLPFTSMQEMIGYAKANSGKLSIAITTPHFAMLASWIDKRAGISSLQVPYKAAPQAIQDILAGRVSLFLTNYGFFERYLKEGQVRVIALTGPAADAPQIPTFAALFPGFTFTTFFSLVGPANMPRELVLRINRIATTLVESPRFNQDVAKLRWRNLGGARTPEGTAEFQRKSHADWGAFIREIGIQPQ